MRFKSFYLLAFFALLFPSFAFADIACYSSCDLGAERVIADDDLGEACGVGSFSDYPLEDEPFCHSYIKPACSRDMLWMCDTQTSCESLSTDEDTTHWTGQECITTDYDDWYSDFTVTASPQYQYNETVRLGNNVSTLIRFLNFYIPLLVLFSFLSLFSSVISLFIRKKI